MNNWTDYLQANGTKTAPANLPDSSMIWDANNEGSSIMPYTSNPILTSFLAISTSTGSRGGLQVGQGNQGVYIDKNGVYAGNAVFASAPFRVDLLGNLFASSATISGAITGGTITIGTASTGFFVDVTGNLWLGAATFAAAPFKVDKNGNLTATSATITGYIQTGGAAADVNGNATTISGGKITTGSVTANQMQTGTITAASGIIGSLSASVITTGTLNAALITVNNLTANSINTGTLNGSVVGVTNLNGSSSGTFASNLLDGSVVNIANLNAGHITAGTLTVGGVSAAAGILINQTTAKANAVLKFQNGSSIWEDSNGNLGLWSFNAAGGTGMYLYTGTANDPRLLLAPLNTQNVVYGGLNFIYDQNSNANLNVWGNTRLGMRTDTSVNTGWLIVGNASAAGMSAGDFKVTGTKAFDIDHPTKKGSRLRYIAIESPEVLVFCRGVAEDENDISFPQHFIDVSEPGTIQCQIGRLRETEKISWFATGIRKGYRDFEPEYTPDSSSIEKNL